MAKRTRAQRHAARVQRENERVDEARAASFAVRAGVRLATVSRDRLEGNSAPVRSNARRTLPGQPYGHPRVVAVSAAGEVIPVRTPVDGRRLAPGERTVRGEGGPVLYSAGYGLRGITGR